MFFAIVFAIILGFIHYRNEKIFFRREESKAKSVSFIAGVSVAYVFLFLLPEMYARFSTANQWIFIFLLLGFSTIHLSEKFLYRHLKGRKRMWREKEIHYIVIFFYSILIGAVSLFLFQKSFLDGALFYLPILFFAAVGRVSFGEVASHLRQVRLLRILLAIAAFIGIIVAPYLMFYPLFFQSIFAFVIGGFLYIALMDFIPAKDKGRPVFFVVGASVYTILIMLTWLV